VGYLKVLTKYTLRKEIGEAVRRIEAARAETLSDPHVRALAQRWHNLARAASRARGALDAALNKRWEAATLADRQFLEHARRENPDLVLITEADGEAMPVLCMATGLAIFTGDAVIGDADAGYAALKDILRIVL
jgi:hypothetical protein